MSTMKLIKKNKFTIICLIVCTILCVAGFLAYKWLFPNFGKPVYGDRLKGINNVEITNNRLEEIGNKLKEGEAIVSASGHITGKIVEYSIVFVESTKIVDAKKAADQLYAEFSEKETDFYDFQVFITNEKEDIEGYPVIGYRKAGASQFSFNRG